MDNNNQGTDGGNPSVPNTGGMGQPGMDMPAAPGAPLGDMSVPSPVVQDPGTGMSAGAQSDSGMGGGMPQTTPPAEPAQTPDPGAGGMGTGIGAPAAEPAVPAVDPSQPMQGGMEMPPAAPAADGSQNLGGENPSGGNPGGTSGM